MVTKRKEDFMVTMAQNITIMRSDWLEDEFFGICLNWNITGLGYKNLDSRAFLTGSWLSASNPTNKSPLQNDWSGNDL